MPDNRHFERSKNSRRSPGRALGLFALACSVAITANGANPHLAPSNAGPAVAVDAAATFGNVLRTSDGRLQVMVELLDPPAAVIYAQAMEGKPANDRAARAAAGEAGKAQTARILSAQSSVAAALVAEPVGARELFRVHNALNGIAVAVTMDRIGEIEKVAGVKRVIPIYPEYPQNSTSVPFIGTPNVWANNLTPPLPAPLAAGADGTGIRIGIIDTGVDYMHSDFGGTGLLADYQAESTDTANFTTVGTATAGPFPTAKVVGGTDFAGDAYTGANAPVPDANPMDCNGHGSHVAGTAAGFGVNTDGTTFAGPYDANTSTYSGLRIGPGTAPKALLYGLRVFGCAGSTGLTTLAIDWAMDPNGDTNLSDHLDVINMSLGSNFGSAVNASSVSSDNAALAGVIVVTSAGNASDTFFISGAPGAASRAIATAASVDSGVAVVSVNVNSPGAIAGGYFGGAAAFGTVPAGETADVVLGLDTTGGVCGTLTTDGCCALTNAGAMAGKICIVDRGTCSFKTKALNCQNAGAIGTLIVNSAPGSPPPGMLDDATIVTPITTPTEMITLADGTLIKNTIAATPPVNATMLGQNGGDTLASFSSRGPRRIFGAPLSLKPDIAAPGLNITSVQTGHTCTVAAGCTGLFDPSGFQAGNQTLTISGTSMACPHMTGIMALLREIHPDWTVEELKALAMNYAVNNVTVFPAAAPPRYNVSRIGAGRVDPSKAAVAAVVAMNAEDAGVVSVTFEQEVTGAIARTKKVRVLNKGTTSQTFDVAIDTVVDSPGVSFSLPGGLSPLTVPAQSTVEFDVQMSADASQMDHTKDPALLATQGVQANYGDQPRNFLTEEGAYVTFSQSATLKFRLPVYMAERPASAMTAADQINTGGAGTGSTTIALSGSDLCTGALAAGPTCTGTFPPDIESAVSPFELQVVSPLDPVNAPDYADIRYVGASYLQTGGTPDINNDLVIFGVASWADWSTLDEVSYNICVDNNNDGVYEKIVYNANPAIFVAGAPFNDNFVRVIRDTTTNGNTILGLGSFVNLVAPSVFDTALHLNNVMLLGATPAQLGLVSTAVTSIRYKVFTCPGGSGCARTTTGDRCSPAAGTFFDQAAGPFFYDWAAQGLNFGGNFLAEDLNGASLPVTWNTANMTTNGSVGALLLHHLNGRGHRAEVSYLEGAAHDDLSVALSFLPVAPSTGDQVTITVTAANAGPDAATGVQVNVPLPPTLSWFSDDSAGAYDPTLGVWTVGALASAGSAVINIVATVDSPGPATMTAVIGGASPVDANAANDFASINVLSAAQANLELSMVSSVPTVLSGDPVTLTLTLTNNGADTAFSVATTLTLSPDVTPTGNTASAGLFTNATKVWNITSLLPGATATLDVTLDAPNSDSLIADATVTSTTADPNTANNQDAVTIPIGLAFYTVAPCRLYDSRTTTPMTSNELRILAVGGSCGVPADARAVSYNVTVVDPTDPGHLVIWEEGAPQPDISSMNFGAGQTRANNGVSFLCTTGEMSVFNASAGSVDIVIDVNGYFN